jgi:hypothetical protein
MASTTDISTVQPKPSTAEMLIAFVTGLMLACTVLFLCVLPLAGKIAGGRDFVVYWATGQQLVHRANPYDECAVIQIERSAGMSPELKVGFMRNPPWGLILALPLGLFGLRTGAVLWSLILFMCLMGSVYMLWRMHGHPKNPLHWLGFSFAPALLCVTMGQTSLFALLGLVLFLRLHRSHPFMAGMSLWFCALKPHLFLPFGVVLLVWIVASRRYKILAGAVAALAASCVAVSLIDPSAWVDYARMMHTYGIEKEFIPCPSIALRFWIHSQATWLQYLLSILGCAWALGYFWRNRNQWDWMQHGSLLMLVSIFTAPYCWIFDQALAIPALLQGAYLTRFRILPVILAFASLLIQIELGCGISVWSISYLWTAPAWLAWYLCATKIREKQVAPIGAIQ